NRHRKLAPCYDASNGAPSRAHFRRRCQRLPRGEPRDRCREAIPTPGASRRLGPKRETPATFPDSTTREGDGDVSSAQGLSQRSKVPKAASSNLKRKSHPKVSSSQALRANYAAGGALRKRGTALSSARQILRRQYRSLRIRNSSDSRRGQRQQVLHFATRKRPPFRRRLNLDKIAAAGHNHVHVHFRPRVLFVGQIKQRAVIDNPNACGGNRVDQSRAFQDARRYQPLHGQRQRNERSGDGSRARSAIGLNYVAIQPNRALAKGFLIRNRAQRSTDEPLNF